MGNFIQFSVRIVCRQKCKQCHSVIKSVSQWSELIRNWFEENGNKTLQNGFGHIPNQVCLNLAKTGHSHTITQKLSSFSLDFSLDPCKCQRINFNCFLINYFFRFEISTRKVINFLVSSIIVVVIIMNIVWCYLLLIFMPFFDPRLGDINPCSSRQHGPAQSPDLEVPRNPTGCLNFKFKRAISWAIIEATSAPSHNFSDIFIFGGEDQRGATIWWIFSLDLLRLDISN